MSIQADEIPSKLRLKFIGWALFNIFAPYRRIHENINSFSCNNIGC